MAHTYNYLKTVLEKLKQENSRHSVFVFIVLSLACIPLSYAANSVALVLLALATVYNFKKNHTRLDLALLLPVLLYLLMVVSLAWTIDREETIPSISKELPLLVIPVCFMLFAPLSGLQRNKVVGYYSFAIALFSVFYLLKALMRFAVSGDVSVFFYHELVTKDVNAIHVSVFVSVAFFYFLQKVQKTIVEKACLALLFTTLFLLSSKNIIAVFLVLTGLYYLFFSDATKRAKVLALTGIAAVIVSLAFVPQIRERFKIEFETAASDHTVNDDIGPNVRNVSLRRAWSANDFTPNDYFPGTAFRVYQFRIFLEMMAKDNAWLTGYGLNASYKRIAETTIAHNLYLGPDGRTGYQSKNFHNQYLQNFAELGIFGFALLVSILALNLKNAVKTKDFVHISFAVLMISLFLTESFLWRQRGVTFFTIMYCLFNSGIAIGKNKNL